MLSKRMFPTSHRAYRLAATSLAVLFILICALQCVAEQPTATAVITDRAALPASNRFGMPNQFKLAGTGDVFFTSGGNTGLFRWSQAAGRKRLLQANDPLEVLGLDLPEEEAEQLAGSLLDTPATLLQANGSYAAFLVSFAIKGVRDPAAVFIYDGSSYRIVDQGVGLETFTQLLLNANGRVAILGNGGPLNLGPQRIYVETAPGVVESVAEQGRPAPPSVGGTITSLSLIGLSDTGQVAFLAGINGGTANRAVFLSDGTTPLLVVKNNDLAPGTAGRFNLANSSFFVNNDGKVAFVSDTNIGKRGIWIGSGSAAPEKLVLQGEATGTAGWGNYDGPFTLRGFNDSGQVLFDSNIADPPPDTPNYALFLKKLAVTAQVVFYRGQSPGPGGAFDATMQATLNNAGKVALLARGPSPSSLPAWYLGAGDAPPVEIAVQGSPTPIGGAFGLAGRNTPALLNAGNQVLFVADILESNAVGLFSWTSGGGVRSVVSTNDSLPAGARAVLRAGPPSGSDTETLVRILKAGGQAAWYAKPLETGMTGLRKIVAEFDQVPDAGTVVGPSGFSMNRKGEVVFTAGLLGSDFYPRAGMLASRPASGLERVILVGADLPGGGHVASFSTFLLNNQTQVAFFASVDIPNTSGVFLASPEPPYYQKVVRTGDAWPTDDLFTISSLNSSLSFNDSGQVAFLGTRSSSGPSGLFIGSAAGPPLKVVEGTDPAPSGTFNAISTPFKLNAAGKVAFMANYTSGQGVFLGTTSGSPQAIATSGSIAPGTDDGTFGSFNSSTIDLNSSGQVAFWAGVNDSGNDTGNGWFLGSAPASLSARLLQNQELPGGGQANMVSPGSRFAVLADSGEMAIYVADTSETEFQPQIVIAGVDGKLRKFTRNGEKADGTGSEFAKLYPTLVATPSGKFLFGAVLINGPAKAGIFMNKP